MLDLAFPSPRGLIDPAWLILLHAAWLGLLVGFLASLMESLGRPASPARRHAAILSALVVMALAAPAAALAQRSLSKRGITASSGDATIRAAAEAPAATSPVAAPEPIATPRPEPTVGRGALWRRMIGAAFVFLIAFRPYLLASWIAGASAFAAALVVGAARVRRLEREAIHLPALERRTRALGRALRAGRIPPAREHPGIAEPCLAGTWRPMILLPSRWLATAPAAEVDAVLAHELAHARRLDHLANLLLRAVEAAYWFHPGVRRACRAARREAERAADALAVRLTGDPLSLARALDSVARSLPSRPRSPRTGLAVGGDRPALLPRIQELLGMKPVRPRFPLRALAALPAAAVLALAAVSTAPAQGPFGATAQTAPHLAPLRASGAPNAPPDPAEVEWRAKVDAIRAKIANPDSDAYAMSVLLRLVPGRPHRGEPAPAPELAPEALSEADVIRLASTRPERLSRDDLVLLVRTIPHDGGDSAKLSREELLRIADPNQISFRVRFFQTRRDPETALRWRSYEAAGPALLIPESSLDRFLEPVPPEPVAAVVEAPRVTTFEGAWSVVSAADDPLDDESMERLRTAGDRGGADARLVSRLDGLIPDSGDAPKLLVTDRLRGGLFLQSTAIRKPWGHAVEVRFLGTLPGDANAAPRTVERLARLNVPDGGAVLLDTGMDVLGIDGDPNGPRLRTFAAVYPLHILNEVEEKAVNGPVDGFAATPTVAR